MSDVLCIYYSRSGNTKQAMGEIAAALDAEMVELRDSVDRSGALGFWRSGMDAMRQEAPALLPFETGRPLEEYSLVIVGTPVWAGRCSAPARMFLRNHGKKLRRAAFVLTRGGEKKYEDVYRQMDQYLTEPHAAAVSLRCGSVGYQFWQDDFVRQARELLDAGQ